MKTSLKKQLSSNIGVLTPNMESQIHEMTVIQLQHLVNTFERLNILPSQPVELNPIY